MATTLAELVDTTFLSTISISSIIKKTYKNNLIFFVDDRNISKIIGDRM